MTMIDQLNANATAAGRKKSKAFQHDERGSGRARLRSKEDLDKELDEALEDSFPSSDPPSISQPKGH